MTAAEKRAIIITDPCYFVKDKDWGTGFDYETMTINIPGFTDYIWINTGFGDGSGRVFLSNKPFSQYELEETIISLRKGEENKDFVDIGKFGVDSGTFGAFFLDEVLKYYPDFTLDVGSWCYTVLPDFRGALYETSLDESDENSEDEDYYCYNYIIGSGNKSICTIW